MLTTLPPCRTFFAVNPMNTPNHQTARQQLWCNTVIAVAASSNSQYKETSVAWADHVLKAFDERFPEKPSVAEPPDSTRLVVPIPEEMLPLPPVPEGHDKWVGRGTFRSGLFRGEGRLIRYWDTEKWTLCANFSSHQFHIEAVKEGDQ